MGPHPGSLTEWPAGWLEVLLNTLSCTLLSTVSPLKGDCMSVCLSVQSCGQHHVLADVWEESFVFPGWGNAPPPTEDSFREPTPRLPWGKEAGFLRPPPCWASSFLSAVLLSGSSRFCQTGWETTQLSQTGYWHVISLLQSSRRWVTAPCFLPSHAAFLHFSYPVKDRLSQPGSPLSS